MSSLANEEPGSVRVLIADCHELFRLGLAVTLRLASNGQWQVAGQTHDGEQAIELAGSLEPGLAIVDVSLVNPNGLKVIAGIRAASRATRVIAVSMHMAMQVTRKVRRAGASAMLAKNESPQGFVAAVRRVLAGEAFVASESAWRDAWQLPAGERIPAQYVLSEREIDVVKLLANGYSSKKIADELGISVRTAEVYRADIFSRISARSLGELIRLVANDGLI